MSTRRSAVSFVDFEDPWGNQLGFYEDLAPNGQKPPEPGGSVRDESLFVTDPPEAPTDGVLGRKGSAEERWSDGRPSDYQILRGANELDSGALVR